MSNDPTERDDYYEPRIAKTPLPKAIAHAPTPPPDRGDARTDARTDVPTLEEQIAWLQFALTEYCYGIDTDNPRAREYLHAILASLRRLSAAPAEQEKARCETCGHDLYYHSSRTGCLKCKAEERDCSAGRGGV